jgi:hypothetical protein
MTLAHFDKEDDIMNNVGDVYTVKALKPWRTPPTPPGEDPMSGDDELAGYVYTIKNYHGEEKTIRIEVDTNTDSSGVTWRKNTARGIKKRKTSKKRKSIKKGRKVRKGSKGRKSRK